MALPDLTGQNIENTYQRILQTDGTLIYDGTGSIVNLPTGSFITTSSFNAFTGSYNTGSFTGSFTGSLFGTASYAQTGGDLTTRYTTTFIATEGQTDFTVVQELPIGYFDVYLNGVKVNDISYSATDLTITFDDPCIVGDVVDIISYNTLRLASRDTRRNAIDSVDSNINYCGVAPNGSLESALVWTITRIVVAIDGSVTITFAYDVAWTNRESATYT